MTEYTPYVRILLRYLVGAGLMGSQQIGSQLAMDPDLVLILSGLLGLVVEAAYGWAKRSGGKT